MSPVSSIALAGIQAAEDRAATAASDLAQGTASGTADVPGDFVTLSMAKVQVQASVAVERAADQMQKTLLDLFA